MNIKLLRRIQKQILKEPKQFQMEELFTSFIPAVKIPNCGTAACIAGWATCIINKAKPAELKTNIEDWGSAARAIGLNCTQCDRLFYFESWPKKYTKIIDEGTPAFARQAVRRIDHFIKTKGAE